MTAILIAKTMPEQSMFTPQSLIAYMAKVSNPKSQGDMTRADNLFKYLIKNKHWSPFEMVHLVIEIRTTRDISRQILRHRSFTFQEFSQRYAEVESELITNREARLQDEKNRQNSLLSQDPVEQEKLQRLFSKAQIAVAKVCKKEYKALLNAGVAKEVARSILPEGMTPTTMYMSGSLRSWIHYVLLREGNGTQKEHSKIAIECREILFKEFPLLRDIWPSLQEGK